MRKINITKTASFETILLAFELQIKNMLSLVNQGGKIFQKYKEAGRYLSKVQSKTPKWSLLSHKGAK